MLNLESLVVHPSALLRKRSENSVSRIHARTLNFADFLMLSTPDVDKYAQGTHPSMSSAVCMVTTRTKKHRRRRKVQKKIVVIKITLKSVFGLSGLVTNIKKSLQLDKF